MELLEFVGANVGAQALTEKLQQAEVAQSVSAVEQSAVVAESRLLRSG